MAEIELTDAEVLALQALQAAGEDTAGAGPSAYQYSLPNEDYSKKMTRQEQRLLTMASVSDAGRVFKDGDLTYGVRAISWYNNGVLVEKAEATAQVVINNDTNYVYYTAAGTLVDNITGFPTDAPFIPLATILTAAGTYAYDDITDKRQGAFIKTASPVAAGIYPIRLDQLLNADDGLELDGAAGNFEISVGGFGSGTRTILGNAASGAVITDTLMYEFRIPPNYVEADTIQIIVKAEETVGAATAATTLSSEVYEDDEDGTVTAVGSSWDATDIPDSATTFTNTLTATNLDAGDLLRVLIRIVTDDTAGTVGTIVQISYIEMLVDLG